jgi:hypothetical protein
MALELEERTGSIIGAAIEVHRALVFVADPVVVELKACKDLVPEHFAVVRSSRAVTQPPGTFLVSLFPAFMR